MHLRLWLFLLGSCLLTDLAQAYSGFISYGYKACNSCHYDPNGNGPLTDYGRGLWASEIAAKPPWGSELTDEELGERSHFLYKTQLPFWIRPQAGYRGILVTRALNKPFYLSYMTMKADASVVLRADEENKLFGVVNLSYIEDPNFSSTSPTRPSRHLTSRAHYVAYRPNDSLTLLAGFTDIAFGLRIPEHVAFSRMYTGLGSDDQTHGLLAKYQTEDWELSVQGFAGNLFQRPEVRAKGASVLYEREVRPDTVLGGSALFSTNDFRNKGVLSVHARMRLWEASSLISELGVLREVPSGQSGKTGVYLFSQFQAPITRGLLFLPTGEFYTESGGATPIFRLGPGLLWFPFQRVELRLEDCGGQT